MKILGSLSHLMVLQDEAVDVFDKLPTGSYSVEENMQGPYLRKLPNYEYQEHLYGDVDKRAHTVLNLYKHSTRNVGAILSGTKGMGKTILAKQISALGYEEELPTIVVDKAIPHVKEILNNIDQRCIVLLDEFEKNFPIDSDGGDVTQGSLLNLFDGISTSNKLFIITCNNTNSLSSYILNRPGRFHYHFRFQSVDPETIEGFMKDNVPSISKENLDSVVRFGVQFPITFDDLKEISIELNLGTSLEDTMKWINIDDTELNADLMVHVLLKDGTKIEGPLDYIDSSGYNIYSTAIKNTEETLTAKGYIPKDSVEVSGKYLIAKINSESLRDLTIYRNTEGHSAYVNTSEEPNLAIKEIVMEPMKVKHTLI